MVCGHHAPQLRGGVFQDARDTGPGTARRAYAQALAELGASPVGQARVHRLPPKQPATPKGISKFFT
jgi:hypothetical protein